MPLSTRVRVRLGLVRVQVDFSVGVLMIWTSAFGVLYGKADHQEINGLLIWYFGSLLRGAMERLMPSSGLLVEAWA